MNIARLVSTTAAAAILAGAALPAAAQTTPAPATAATPAAAADQAQSDPADTGGNDIIVTAQRRDQRLQDVPISVTALTADELTGRGITSTHDIAQSVTGMTITESGGYVQPFIRGVGSTVTNLGEQGSTATYIDGVYMPIVGGQLYDLANVESIQVLKGPQGTLFGRNANSGAIIITTRQPQQDLTGNLTVGYGNLNSFKAAGFVTGGLTEGVAVSLAGNYDRHDGWFRNLNPANGFGRRVGDGKRYTLRGSVLLQPTSNLKVTLIVDGMNADDPSPIILQPIDRYQGYVPGALLPRGRYDYIGNEHVRYLNGQWGVSGKVDWDLGPVQLISTSAFRHFVNSSYFYDSDTTPARLSAISDREVGDSYTQELQLNSTGTGNFNWVIGAFYLRQDARYAPLRVDSGAVTTRITAQQVTEAYAAFADGTYTLGDFELTGGLRYSKDRKAYDGQVNGVARVNNAHKSWSSVTPRVVLAYHPSRALMLYGSFSQGFKGGTFNANGLSSVPVNPETVDAYELGLKLMPARRVTLNMAAFHYLTSDLQVQALNPANNLITIINAAKVRSNGVDVDLSWEPVDDLSLRIGASYLDAKFTRFPNAQVFLPVPGGDGRNAPTLRDVTGKKNVRSPDFTFNVAADYKFEFGNGSSIVPSFNVYHSSKFYWTVDNRIVEPSHFVANASLTWNAPGDRFSVAIWGRNIFGEVRFRNVSAAAQADRRAADEPALYGVRAGLKF